MKGIIRTWRFIGLGAAVAAALMVAGGRASADDLPYLSVPSVALVNGLFYDSGAVLEEDINASQVYIKINHYRYLRVGWTIKIDSEQMLIMELINEDPPADYDTMRVFRAQNGTQGSSHSDGTAIKGYTAKAYINVNDITNPDGLGAWQVTLTYDPSKLQYARMLPNSAYMGSTGRNVNWYGPYVDEEAGTIEVGIYTDQWPILPPPVVPGPTEPGILATVWFRYLDEGSSNLGLQDTYLADPSAEEMEHDAYSGFVSVLTTCPDTNLDGWANILDVLNVACNLFDSGVDSGATVTAAVDGSQTTIEVSDAEPFSVDDVISIDAEQMTVVEVDPIPDPPVTIEVTRGTYGSSLREHEAGTEIYIATVDGNHDGEKGYTRLRDVNPDLIINILDPMIVAQVMTTQCSQ